MRVADLSVSSLFWHERNLCSLVQKRQGTIFTVHGINLSSCSTASFHVKPSTDLSLPKSIEPDLLKWPTHFIYWLFRNELSLFRRLNEHHEIRYRIPRVNPANSLADPKTYGDFSNLFYEIKEEASRRLRNHPYERGLSVPNAVVVSEFIKNPQETIEKRTLAADEGLNKKLLIERQRFFSKLKNPRKKLRQRARSRGDNSVLKPRCREMDPAYAKEIKEELLKEHGKAFPELKKLISLAEKLPKPYKTLAFTIKTEEDPSPFNLGNQAHYVPLILYLAKKYKKSDPTFAVSIHGAKGFDVDLFSNNSPAIIRNLLNSIMSPTGSAVDTACTKVDMNLPLLYGHVEEMLTTGKKNGLKTEPRSLEKGEDYFYFPRAHAGDSRWCPKPLGWPLSYMGRINRGAELKALKGETNSSGFHFLLWVENFLHNIEEEGGGKRISFNHGKLNTSEWPIEKEENKFLEENGKHSSKEKVFECPRCCMAIYNLWYKR